MKSDTLHDAKERKHMCENAHIYSVCRYMHTFTCIKLHIHINAYANWSKAMPEKEIYVCICGNMGVYMRKYMCVYAEIYVCICTHLRHMSLYANIYMYQHRYTHEYIHTPIKRQTPHDGKERNAFRRARGRHERLVPCVTWLIHAWRDLFSCDMTHSCVTAKSGMPLDVRAGDTNDVSFAWRDSFTYALTHSCVTSWLILLWHDSFIWDMTHSCVTWLIHVWHDAFTFEMTHSHATRTTCPLRDMTHLYVWHDSFMYVTWLIHVRHDRHVPCVTWLVLMWHDSVTFGMTHSRMAWLIHIWIDSNTCPLRDMTHSHVTWLCHICHDLSSYDMTHSHSKWRIHTQLERLVPCVTWHI